jgi:hypothetical protein
MTAVERLQGPLRICSMAGSIRSTPSPHQGCGAHLPRFCGGVARPDGAILASYRRDSSRGPCQVGGRALPWQPAWKDDLVQPYRGFRFPAEVIQHAVWLYHCFSLSLRDVELILAVRGVVVSYESIRDWGIRFGRLFANTLKRRRPRPGDKWFMDKVLILSANSGGHPARG